MLALSFLPTLILQISEASAIAGLPRAPGALAPLLVPRQAFGLDPSTLPTHCRGFCTPFWNAINTCVDMSCTCTAANAVFLAACVDCVVKARPSADAIFTGQSLLDEYAEGCHNSGLPFPSQTVNTVATITLPASTSAASSTSGANTSTPDLSSATSTATLASTPSSPPKTGGVGRVVKNAGMIVWVGFISGAVLGLGVIGI